MDTSQLGDINGSFVGLAASIAENPALIDMLRSAAEQLKAQHLSYGFANAFRVMIPNCSTLPMDWREAYHQEGYSFIDPVIGVTVGSRRALYLNCLDGNRTFEAIWKTHASQYGIAAPTIGVPMFGPHGETCVFQAHFVKPPRYEDERKRLLHKVVAFAETFHDGVMEHYGVDRILGIPRLSERERHVMFLAAEGRSTADISHTLGISNRTVETHMKHCREKLGARNMTHAVARAVYMGTIQAPDSASMPGVASKEEAGVVLFEEGNLPGEQDAGKPAPKMEAGSPAGLKRNGLSSLRKSPGSNRLK